MDRREIGWVGVDWIWLRTSGRPCGQGNEASGSIKCWEIL
jgi:hypothetical protein